LGYPLSIGRTACRNCETLQRFNCALSFLVFRVELFEADGQFTTLPRPSRKMSSPDRISAEQGSSRGSEKYLF
jgi:hypothetical protein